MLMRTPLSEEDSDRLFSPAKEEGNDLSLYLLGDGVLCARRGQMGYHGAGVREAILRGARVKASARDLRARGVSREELMDGVVPTEDLEGELVEEVMNEAGRVFSW